MFLSGSRIKRIVLALLLGGVAFLVYHRYREIEEQQTLRFFDRPILYMVASLEKGSLFVRGGIGNIFNRYFFLVGVEKENESLRKQIDDLKVSELSFREISKENDRLRHLLDLRATLSGDWVAARVVSYPPMGPYRLMTIDKGSNDGVQKRASVVSPDGLVGQVTRVMKDYSQVLLITDPTSAVDARLGETDARGLVVGKVMKLGFDRNLFLDTFEYLKQATSIEEGMEVTTSGLDGIYPPGVRIGSIISKQKKKYDVFQQADVLPAVNFYKLREVIVLKK